MKINKKALLYDISNLAYTIADLGDNTRHSLHQVRDICEDGNIDRVNAVLALTFSKVLALLGGKPCLHPHKINMDRGKTVTTDFVIPLKKYVKNKYLLTPEIEMNFKETVREYLVCCVLADWLDITLPEAADVWRFRAEACFSALQERIAALSSEYSHAFRRRTPQI